MNYVLFVYATNYSVKVRLCCMPIFVLFFIHMISLIACVCAVIKYFHIILVTGLAYLSKDFPFVDLAQCRSPRTTLSQMWSNLNRPKATRAMVGFLKTTEAHISPTEAHISPGVSPSLGSIIRANKLLSIA